MELDMDKSTVEEIYLSRALAREIDLALSDGSELPLNVVLAYKDLVKLYNRQIELGTVA
jgi:hypothetical protein